MHLYLLRHGQADWPDWKGPDDERPLTEAGRKEMRAVGEFLVRAKVRVDSVLTSPLPRAEQTADIAAEHLKVVCRVDRLLAPGFDEGDLKRLLRKHPQDALMLVGHEPDLSEIIGDLTGGRVKMPKAGLALIECGKKKGKLLWLVPPRLVRR